jgi:AraC-like DNA-binding protein
MPSVPHVRLDSRQFPPGDAFDMWQAAIPIYRISLGPNVSRENFHCDSISWFLGDLILSRTDVSAVKFIRADEQIRADGVDSYSFFVFTSGSWAGDVDGRPMSAGPGQVVGFDLSKPFVAQSTASRGVALSVARTAIGNGLRADPDLHGHVFEGASADLLLDHILSLERHLPSMTEADVAPVVGATLAMLLAAVTTIPRRSDPRPSALVFQHSVRRFIDNNLHDPALTPDHIANQLAVARSTLSRSFAPLGGLARYIQRRRLEAIRALLRHPGETRSISELARTFGFASASHFAVAFRKAYGCTAREMRDQDSFMQSAAPAAQTAEMPSAFRGWMRELQRR